MATFHRARQRRHLWVLVGGGHEAVQRVERGKRGVQGLLQEEVPRAHQARHYSVIVHGLH